ncbi:hypothetical protein J1N35_033636 [Gossypium stocksii]|uniref:DUF7722 domain-containing protein n=1 Tax=Gossypium stocksii TaxID=47602 RepID=A0A9D3UQS1_9ROSI|nr:hypothetical protein J1N35_033636 [Gossypium stocksii]
MALRWFLHSLGYQPDDMQYCKNMASEQSGAVTQSSKVSSNGELMAVKAKMHPALGFQMPLHYPCYTKVDYEKMEWKVDMLLSEYGLSL